MADRFSLTSDQVRQIRQWEQEKAQLEREIAERQGKLSDIAEKLKAVAVLGVVPAETERPIVAPVNGNGGASSSNLIAAIERIATTSPAPLSKKEIKQKLRAEHFPESRIGPYFYTCLMRLKERSRIRVLEDGKVWKP